MGPDDFYGDEEDGDGQQEMIIDALDGEQFELQDPHTDLA